MQLSLKQYVLPDIIVQQTLRIPTLTPARPVLSSRELEQQRLAIAPTAQLTLIALTMA